MRVRLLLSGFAILAVLTSAQSVMARPGNQAATSTPTATAAGAAAATAMATATATLTASPVPVPAVRVTPEVLPSTPGVTARFTVSFSSTVPGQGEVYFGTSCIGLVEVATQDQHAGTTQHAVTVTGNDLPGTVGDNGIQPGVTYYFETVTVTRSGSMVDNNGGKCYSVTIPTATSSGTLHVLTATMLGSNEVPTGAPGGSGFATITIDTATNTVCWTLSASGVTLPAIAAHIHKGAAGVPGPVVIPLSPPGAGGTSTGCTTADAALVEDIVANPSSYYVNVHTTEFPAGAIRGQLGTQRVLTATMLGNSEVPSGAPGGRGFATITIDTATNTVCWTLSASGITLPAIASHIHKGAVGVAGPVVQPLTPPDANGTSTGCAAIDPALAQDIIANPSSYYVNVHTIEFPAGAIRGQLG